MYTHCHMSDSVKCTCREVSFSKCGLSSPALKCSKKVMDCT